MIESISPPPNTSAGATASMPKILIAPSHINSVGGKFEGLLKNAGFELVCQDVGRQLLENELIQWLDGCVASLAGSEPYTRKVMDAHPQLRVIARIGVGFDAVDVAAATEKNIAVTIAPGTNQGSVAEHAFALMLALVKGIVPQHLGVKAGGFPRGINKPLRGQVLGIAGLGRAGKALATRAQAFEMPVIAYDPYPDHAFAKAHNIPFVSFDELLEKSDIISLHLPATPESRHIINAKSLAKMKKTALLINTARGHVLDEDALGEALANGTIGGAGIDVFEVEPPGKLSWFDLPNLVLTPHAAGVDSVSLAAMADSAAEAVVSLYKNEWPAEKMVNPSIRERFHF